MARSLWESACGVWEKHPHWVVAGQLVHVAHPGSRAAWGSEPFPALGEQPRGSVSPTACMYTTSVWSGQTMTQCGFCRVFLGCRR